MAQLSITQRRQSLAQSLLRQLDADFTVVSAPDHPLVLRSVDVLVGGRSGLTAVMMKTAEERREPSLFAARLTLNRMALPFHTNFVYMATDGEEVERSSANSFVAQLSFEEKGSLEELTKIAAAPQRFPEIRDAEGAHLRAERRFGHTYRLVRLLQQERLPDQDAELGVVSQSEPRSRRPLRDDFANGVPGAYFREPPTLPVLSRLNIEGVARWFDGIGKEAQPTGNSAGAMIARNLPHSPGDPEKAMRAAAFAGWVFVQEGGQRSQNEVSDLILKFTRLP